MQLWVGLSLCYRYFSQQILSALPFEHNRYTTPHIAPSLLRRPKAQHRDTRTLLSKVKEALCDDDVRLFVCPSVCLSPIANVCDLYMKAIKPINMKIFGQLFNWNCRSTRVVWYLGGCWSWTLGCPDPSGSDGGLWYSGPRCPATTPETELRFHRCRSPVATQSYLVGRSQYVRRGDAKSTIVALMRGVPQGQSSAHNFHYVHCRLDLSDWKPWQVITAHVYRRYAGVVLEKLVWRGYQRVKFLAVFTQ